MMVPLTHRPGRILGSAKSSQESLEPPGEEARAESAPLGQPLRAMVAGWWVYWWPLVEAPPTVRTVAGMLVCVSQQVA